MGVQERRARQKEGVREEILDAARTLFVKEGYEHVSIRKIAEKVEYAPGTIYLYFRDKAEILDRTFVQAKQIERQNPVHASAERCFDFLRNGVQRCIDAGQLNCQDADEVAQALWAGMHGITTLLITGSFPFIEHNRLIDRVVHILVEGVRKR